MKRCLLIVLTLLVSVPFLLCAKEFKVVTYSTETAGKVIFDHVPHLKKLTNNCTVCHNSLYRVDKTNPTATMADMEKGKSCGLCHNKVKAFALAECTRCHIVKEVPIVIPDFGTLIFSHKFHLGIYPNCADCHNKIFRAGPGNPHVSMADMEKGKSCGACHDGKTAFSVKEKCTTCHTVKDVPFASADPFSHSFHLQKKYGCSDCHSKLFIAGPNSKRYTMREMENGNSCGGCHNAKIAFSVKGDCNKCHAKVGNIEYKASEALFSHSFHLGIYICADCHSGIFVGGANRRSYTMADMEKEKGRSCGACHEGSVAFSVSGSCDRCHIKTKELTWKVPAAGTAIFSHTFHQKLYKCDDCHFKVFATGTASKRYTMADMEAGKSCGVCHNGKTAFSAAGSCGKCHPVRNIYFGYDGFFSHERHLEMYRCASCHNDLYLDGPNNKRRTMPDMENGKSCGACHDAKSAFSVKGDCDKCHKSAPELSIKVPSAGDTKFSHKIHTALYKCNDCHNKLFTTGVAAKRFSMADMEAGKSCGACHDDKSAFTAKANCTRCHPVKDIHYKPTGALFSHTYHLGLYRCESCHDKIFIPGTGRRSYTMPDMEKGYSCGACHDGKTAFTVAANCQKCHVTPKAIRYQFVGKSPEAALFSHKLHSSKGYKCEDCHYKVFATGVNRRSYTMQEMGTGKSCGACHGYNITGSPSCGKCHTPETKSDSEFEWKPPPEDIPRKDN